MNSFTSNFRIFMVLITRDLRLLLSNLSAVLVDCIMPLITQIITFGYLFPLLGMPVFMVAPIYLGGMLALLLQLGFSLVVRTGFDLEYSRFIDYHITLPIAKRWLFAAYIINNVVELALVTLPLLTVGILVLHKFFILSSLKLLPFLLTYVIVLLYFSSLFLALSYMCSINWILDNAWPRILVPLWWISGALVIWKTVYTWWPMLGKIMLLSPFTYVAEGIRSALLGTDQYIDWRICVIVLIACIIVHLFCLSYGIKKKLDPV